MILDQQKGHKTCLKSLNLSENSLLNPMDCHHDIIASLINRLLYLISNFLERREYPCFKLQDTSYKLQDQDVSYKITRISVYDLISIKRNIVSLLMNLSFYLFEYIRTIQILYQYQIDMIDFHKVIIGFLILNLTPVLFLKNE